MTAQGQDRALILQLQTGGLDFHHCGDLWTPPLSRIPSALKEAVRKYGVLVPPLGPWGYPGKRGTEDPVIYHDLEEAIYVPIDVVHKHGCGGLRLYRHPKNFSTIPDFCERDFGKSLTM